jgi:hypothetical protein
MFGRVSEQKNRDTKEDTVDNDVQQGWKKR